MGTDVLTIGGGIAGLFAFVLAMTQVISSSRTWKELIGEIRHELTDCRKDRETERVERQRERGDWAKEKSAMNVQITSLQGEVISLRRDVHADRWLGIDPMSRGEIFDQEANKTGDN